MSTDESPTRTHLMRKIRNAVLFLLIPAILAALATAVSVALLWP